MAQFLCPSHKSSIEVTSVDAACDKKTLKAIVYNLEYVVQRGVQRIQYYREYTEHSVYCIEYRLETRAHSIEYRSQNTQSVYSKRYGVYTECSIQRAQSTEHRVYRTVYRLHIEHRVQNIQYRVQTREFKAQSTEYRSRVLSTQYREQVIEFRAHSTEQKVRRIQSTDNTLL